MIRVLVRLTPEQYERLNELASRQSKSLSQLVREGVDGLIAAERIEMAWDRFLAAAGSCRATDGVADVSVRHDAYLSDVFARG